MIIKQVEGDKSIGLWPICAIVETHMLIFNFVIIFVGGFVVVVVVVKTVMFWKFFCDWIMKL